MNSVSNMSSNEGSIIACKIDFSTENIIEAVSEYEAVVLYNLLKIDNI